MVCLWTSQVLRRRLRHRRTLLPATFPQYQPPATVRNGKSQSTLAPQLTDTWDSSSHHLECCREADRDSRSASLLTCEATTTRCRRGKPPPRSQLSQNNNFVYKGSYSSSKKSYKRSFLHRCLSPCKSRMVYILYTSMGNSLPFLRNEP